MVKWIRNAEFNNYTHDQIYAAMIRQGYTPNEAVEAFTSAHRGQAGAQINFKEKKSSFLMIILISILAVTVIIGLFFLITPSSKNNPEIDGVNTSSTGNITGSKENTSGASVNTSTIVEATTICGDMGCFVSKFVQCRPASITSNLTSNLVYYYEVIGPKDGLCEVKLKFLANPDPNWMGKEMICKYNNSKAFDTAIQDMSLCQGPLYNLMR